MAVAIVLLLSLFLAIHPLVLVISALAVLQKGFVSLF